MVQRIFGALLSLIIACAFLSGVACSADEFTKRRQGMVKKDIESRGVRDRKVLDAMMKVPRHLFVDKG